MNEGGPLSGPVRATLIVGLFVFGLPGVVLVAMLAMGQSPFNAAASVVTDESGVFQALATPAPPVIPATDTATTASESSNQSVATSTLSPAAASEVVAQSTAATTNSSASVDGASASAVGSTTSSPAATSVDSSTENVGSDGTSVPNQLPAASVPTLPKKVAPVTPAIVPISVPELLGEQVGQAPADQLSAAEPTSEIATPAVPRLPVVDTSIDDPIAAFAHAYSLIGAIVAALASILHWALPYLANHPTSGSGAALARRIRLIHATARGFGYLEYPLLLLGTVLEVAVLAQGTTDQPLHISLLMVYLALWLFQFLVWLKRPIVGRTVTARQEPIESALVRAIDAERSRLVATVATDSSGRFTFHVHPGTYELTVEKTGFEPHTIHQGIDHAPVTRLMVVLTATGELSNRQTLVPLTEQLIPPATGPEARAAVPVIEPPTPDVKPLTPLTGSATEDPDVADPKTDDEAR